MHGWVARRWPVHTRRNVDAIHQQEQGIGQRRQRMRAGFLRQLRKAGAHSLFVCERDLMPGIIRGGKFAGEIDEWTATTDRADYITCGSPSVTGWLSSRLVLVGLLFGAPAAVAESVEGKCEVTNTHERQGA
jgi:hypothetical protein